MAFSANSTSGPSSEINVTPLIDVLLVLLIIFMVIVPNAQRGLESSLPQGRASAALPPIVVRLLGADPAQPLQYRIGEHAVAYAELQPSLRGLFAARQDRTLFVQADRNLSYQQVAAVVGEARKAGAGAVVLQPAAKPLSTKP